MIINFEFLDEEPIENVITCLHYKVDKVVFFGSKEMIAKKEKSLRYFLDTYCSVCNVSFREISDVDLNAVVDTMREAIKEERKVGNECYIDVTGGEGLALLAFGILSHEQQVPMHMYDIEKDEVLEFDRNDEAHISKNVPAQHVKLNLNMYIEMHGGEISERHNKKFKGEHSESNLRDVEKIWKVKELYENEWNQFSMFLAQRAQTMQVKLSAEAVKEDIKNRHSISSIKKLNRILDACKEEGILRDMVYDRNQYAFSYKSEFVKACMCDSGSVLEQYAYMQERNNVGNVDCRVGVHIDWKRDENGEPETNVLNEIDIMSLYGNVPFFISCKNGGVDQKDLFELDAISDRFGGKYAKKVLALSKIQTDAFNLRAKEMGIEVRVF